MSIYFHNIIYIEKEQCECNIIHSHIKDIFRIVYLPLNIKPINEWGSTAQIATARHATGRYFLAILSSFHFFRQLFKSSWSQRLTGFDQLSKRETFLNGSSKTIKILTIKWNTLFCITSTIIFVKSWTTLYLYSIS